MKKLLASASFIVLGSVSALAADLPMHYTKAAPVYAPPVFSWTGCYIGVHGGAGAMHDTNSYQYGNGALAGGQLGCNYQTGMLVFGLEGEGYWSGMKTNYSQSYTGEAYSNIYDSKNKYDYSIAGRFGVAIDRTLIYGKAGWVWGKFNFLETENYSDYSESYAASSTLNGLLLGAGFEYALTNNWTVKFEYNYLNYGSKVLPVTYCETGESCYYYSNSSYSAQKNIFKVGANYLFNMGPAPVVARY